MTDNPAVDQLNEALRVYRRTLRNLLLIVVVGFAAVIALSLLGTRLSPSYGVYIAGEGLGTWGLIVLVVVFFVELWRKGRQLGRLLDDRILTSMPILGLTSAPTVLAKKANALNMAWTGFYGPLRPARTKK